MRARQPTTHSRPSLGHPVGQDPVYDGDNFQLEYMDLESSCRKTASLQTQPRETKPHRRLRRRRRPTARPAYPHHTHVVDLSSRATTSVHTAWHLSPASQPHHTSRDTPSPIDPESIQVPITYDPDPADLALSSVPGQEMFDPRKRKFSAEELKPQPMIKKARKVFIPEDLKDDRYWARRRKNNVAAKRSRDARRLKENQIAIRAGFLEKENAALRMEVADMRKELGRCKNIVAKYEARHGPL
uniref:HLF transcription factor, PAR bZIP family member a n=1 Tax=Labrus bergylta TaxID=56723 RepID=A0A3Q3MMD6_9LABR